MNRLEELRKKHRLSQQQLANMLKITQQAYSNYEKSKREADYDTLLKLSKYFNTTIDYILGNSDDPEPANKKETPSVYREGNLIYEKLVEVGFIKKGEKITEEHLKVLVDIIAPQIDFVHFKLNNGK